jgi:hypothetical protein
MRSIELTRFFDSRPGEILWISPAPARHGFFPILFHRPSRDINNGFRTAKSLINYRSSDILHSINSFYESY